MTKNYYMQALIRAGRIRGSIRDMRHVLTNTEYERLVKALKRLEHRIRRGMKPEVHHARR